MPEEKQVTVTAHFSYQDYPDIAVDKEFELTVLKGSGKKSAPKSSTIDRQGRRVVFVIGDSTASPYPPTRGRTTGSLRRAGRNTSASILTTAVLLWRILP